MLETIELPDTVSVIDGYAFYGCRSLNSIAIPSNVTDIRDYAFCLCGKIDNLTIPSRINLGDYVFDEENLEKIDYREQSNIAPQREYAESQSIESETLIEISDGIATVTECKDKNATEIVISEYYGNLPVKRIAPRAFENCKNLRKVTIPESVNSIGEFAFLDCVSLYDVNLPKDIRVIAWGTFSGCESLRKIVIPDGVTSIVDYAFYGCKMLTEINIPKLNYLGEHAFDGSRVRI